ncbi:hypothetical protein [Microseira wollei]|nr:hypothetical protein [Microseira wollei]
MPCPSRSANSGVNKHSDNLVKMERCANRSFTVSPSQLQAQR